MFVIKPFNIHREERIYSAHHLYKPVYKGRGNEGYTDRKRIQRNLNLRNDN